MTLKLSPYVQGIMKRQAIHDLAKWLLDYGHEMDRTQITMNDAEVVAEMMVVEADTCVQITKEELAKLMEAAYKDGWSTGQGDMRENVQLAWKTSKSLAALKDEG